MSALGIDIGGTSVKAAWIDGDVIWTGRSNVYQQPSRAVLAQAVRDAVDALGVECDSDVAVGLCLPGLQNDAGTCVVESVNLPCLHGWSFDALLEDCLGGRPSSRSVVRDIHATGIDLIRTSRLTGRVAVVAIGTGVGVMVFVDGEPIEVDSLRGFGQQIKLDGVILESCVGAGALRAVVGTSDEREIESYIRSCAADSVFIRALDKSIRVVVDEAKPDVIVLAGGVGIALRLRANTFNEIVPCRVEFGESLFHAASGAALLACE